MLEISVQQEFLRQEIFAIFAHWQEFFANLTEVRENFLHTKICCPIINMKYNAHVFLPESAKGTSEVTQNAQFILRGLNRFRHIRFSLMLQ